MIVVLMGVTGSGKTTTGKALAKRLGWQYAEGDDYHSEANRQKMHAGIPLTDEDRAPWLATLHDLLEGWQRSGTSGVLACSALRQRYRDQLAAGIDPAALRFVLLDAPRAVLQQRLQQRRGHYMNPALLDSQISTLEQPNFEPGSGTLRVSVVQPLDDVVQAIVTGIGMAG